ncbi:MAG TPA: type I-U CRISPR-associated helicase/endonuclease Cas3 [Gemmataceae bacterium]|nr:type I-U CRISPR-associated helicase/endonuclease Cas3 [Gemmataceae bacterium]
MSQLDFASTFEQLTGNSPFPWQEELYKRFVSDRSDNIPSSCNLPTGLGKTSVVAIWLIALANYPSKLPRRLVYVVNRRTVVDQSTDEAIKLRDQLLGEFGPPHPLVCRFRHALESLASDPGSGPLAISTLRGQFADNREWSSDPARPALIAGTVDMIGSRLLFSGYGVGFKGKPLHAGFLGQDVLLVHDEAQLEPAFQELIVKIEKEQERCPNECGKFRVMELSATSRGEGKVFTLTDKEKNPRATNETAPEPLRTVWKRITAKKGLKFHGTERNNLAKEIGKIALRHKQSGKAILVFVRTVEEVKTVYAILTDKKGGAGVLTDQVQVLTGTLRGLERDRLAKDDPIFQRLLLKVPSDGRTVYLICTSAGEVGIDLSADHMVCDLTTYESMAQRLGRVNRRGDGAAEIDVVFEIDRDPKKQDDGLEKSRWQTKAVLERLPKCDWIDDRYEASPNELSRLIDQLTEQERKAAFSPTPEILPVSDILFDAWALTTIKGKLPGRPPVEPYLHGLVGWEPPETRVAWREEVWELRVNFKNEAERIEREGKERVRLEKYAAELLEDYPLKPHEMLRNPTYRLVKELGKLAAAADTPVWVVGDDDGVKVTTLGELWEADKEKLEGQTLLLPPEAGGLSLNNKGTPTGLFEGSAKYEPEHRKVYDVADEWRDKDGLLRQRRWNDETKPAGMKLERIIPISDSDDEDAEATKIWYWFVRSKASDIPNAQGRRKYDLQPHLADAKTAAEKFLANLALDADIRQAVILAAEFHDLGKDRKLWQQGIGNEAYPDEKWAKSGRRTAAVQRSTYRHEFGSLLDVTEQSEFLALSPDLQELVLHLIAAHHGRARPHFPEDEAFDHEPKGRDVPGAAAAVPGRFAKLQRKYGRWGLAYLESLVRAADILASRKAEEGDS